MRNVHGYNALRTLASIAFRLISGAIMEFKLKLLCRIKNISGV